MELARNARWIAVLLPVALAAATTVARPAPPGTVAAEAPGARLCTGSAPAAWTAPASRVGVAWFRLDPRLDATGTLAGQRLTAGRGGARWTVDLPPESFASGPTGGSVLVGDDDGHRSRLRVLDATRGCWTMIATEAAVIRSAVRTSDGTALFEHRVDRRTRADLGVWRRDLAGDGPDAVRVLAGLAPDPALGPTFATDLQLVADGRLVVASCAERACRNRVLDPVAGDVAEVNGTGAVAGVTGSRLVAVAPCDGLPCRLEAVDLSAQSAAVHLDEVDGPAVVAPGATALVVVADDRGLGVVAVADRGAGDADLPGTAGLAPLRRGSTAHSGVEAPVGLVAVAPGGDVGDPAAVRFLDPVTRQLSAPEVLP